MSFFKKAWSPRNSKYDDPFEHEPVTLVSIIKTNKSSPEYSRNKVEESEPSKVKVSYLNKDIDFEEIKNLSLINDHEEHSRKSRKNAKMSNISFISPKVSAVIRSSDVNLKNRCRSKSAFMVPLLRVAPWADKTAKNRNYRSSSLESLMVDLRTDSHFISKRIRSAVSVYVLDHLMTEKRIELLENIYGGKYQSHRSAIIIQRCFRNFRRKQMTKKIFSPYSRKYSTVNKPQNDKRNQVQDDKDGHDIPKQRQYLYDPNDPFSLKDDEERKRLFCLGINLFNRNSNKGINFLIRHNILDPDESSIVKFFETKGLSSYAKGEYMSQDNNKLASFTRREYINKLSFHNCSIEKGVRKLFAHIRVPGETQKILNMVEEFNTVYLSQNVDFRDKLQNPDTVVMIAFAILMLHTSLFNPSARKQDRMSKEDFVRIFRDYTKDPVIPSNYFDEIYDNVKRQQMKPLSDHTDLVRNVYTNLVGPKVPKNLVQNHRKLICHYQLNEIPNIIKKPNSHMHQRDTFLFNDLILITKKTQQCSYHVRHEIPLFGIYVNEFKTEHYPFGIELRRTGVRNPLTFLDCINEDTRRKIMREITNNIEELKQLDELRVNEEVEKIYPKN